MSAIYKRHGLEDHAIRLRAAEDEQWAQVLSLRAIELTAQASQWRANGREARAALCEHEARLLRQEVADRVGRADRSARS